MILLHFSIIQQTSINGDGSVTTTMEEMPEFPEDTAPNDSAIELPDMDFEYED